MEQLRRLRDFLRDQPEYLKTRVLRNDVSDDEVDLIFGVALGASPGFHDIAWGSKSRLGSI